MVHDPRVSTSLARLGGVYRDPARVDRDASSVLKSSVGTHLVPIVAEMFENNGSRSNVLVLQGTIAIHFRAQTYQILVDLYLPNGYPNRPPVPYVRLAPNMYLKENHRHVGSDGKVYLPYLHEWRSHSHNLVELIVAMSSVFSAEPPVFTRRPGAGETAGASASVQATAIPSTNTSSNRTNNNNSNSTSSNNNSTTNNNNNGSATSSSSATVTATQLASGAMMSDEEAIAAVQAQEAQEERRRIEQERKEQEQIAAVERKAQEQREWEQRRLDQLRVTVAAKVRQQLQADARQLQAKAQDTARNVRKMELAHEQKICATRAQLERQRQALQQQVAVAQEATEDIKAWIEQAKAKKEQSHQNGTSSSNGTDNNNNSQPLSIDDKVLPSSRVHAQMMELSAENAAITDCLYFLDRALHQNYVSCEKHLKQVRKLAKRQFLVRAHLIKIHQVLIAEKNTGKN